MRLLNCTTLKLQEFSSNTPSYAILSHRWLETGSEPTYQTLRDGTAHEYEGFEKIKLAGHQALREGLIYLWADTICIDKTNHVELSADINSMYRYYHQATICYAYLNDVHTLLDLPESRWFTRGWTLQELLAPSKVDFYSKNWDYLGAKTDPKLFPSLEKATGICNLSVFEWFYPSSHTIAERMSWASKRTTTRVEDMAYCLLGIFGVSMPLLYGEAEHAFTRLQKQIMQVSSDHSLFAWTDDTVTRGSFCGLLAWGPRLFASFASPGQDDAKYDQYKSKMDEIQRLRWEPSDPGMAEDDPTPWSQTNLGIKIEFPLVPFEALPNAFYALLGYGRMDKRPAIIVLRWGRNRFSRLYCDTEISAQAYKPMLDKYGYQIEQLHFPGTIPLPRGFLGMFGCLFLEHSQMIHAGFNVRDSSNTTKVRKDARLFHSPEPLKVLYTHTNFPNGVSLDLNLKRQDNRIALRSSHSVHPPPNRPKDTCLASENTSMLAIGLEKSAHTEVLLITACIIEEIPWDDKEMYTVLVQVERVDTQRSLWRQLAMVPVHRLRPYLKLLACLILFRGAIWAQVFRKYRKLDRSMIKVAVCLSLGMALRNIDMNRLWLLWERVRIWAISRRYERSLRRRSEIVEAESNVQDVLDLHEEVD